jgi:hypothetical protein
MKISIFLTSLLFIIIVPNTFYMYYEESTSTGAGLAISILIICFLYLLQYRSFHLDKSLLPIFIFLIFTFLTSIYSMILFDAFEYKRFFLSYLMISICVLGAFYFVIFSSKIIDRKLYNYVSFVFYIILFDGIYLLINNTFFIWDKRTLLFPEMSHFSIIFAPLLLFKVLTFKNTTYIYLTILISLLLALNLQNLTLLIITFLIMMIYSIKKTFLFFLVSASIVLLYFDLEVFTYFIDRIPSGDTKNLSALVFLSGWERAYLNLIYSNFFGIGFNQLGFVGTTGFFQSEISRLGEPGLNMYDAGGIAPKLLSELGIVGLAFIFGYLFYLAKAVYMVKKKKLIYSYLDTFYISIFIMSFVSIFIRSSGYFSPIVFLLLSSIIYINKFKLKDHNIFFKSKNSKTVNLKKP